MTETNATTDPTDGDDVAAAEAAAAFRFVVDWQALDAASADAIRAFWQREGAIVDPAQIAQRLPQVVMHATTADGEVAGVCTALLATPPMLAQPFYYWRTFVGARWRRTQLVMMLLKRSCTLLEDYAARHGHPAIGVLLELENERFRERGRMAVWWNPRFVYIGRSARGLDLRVHYFKGARLKPPPSKP
ncbi:MAG TPA: hypothetical protein VGC30_11075 [Dokdonella sp.]